MSTVGGIEVVPIKPEAIALKGLHTLRFDFKFARGRAKNEGNRLS